MKEEILKLRDEGKSYKEIVDILGCSKGTVCYHCGSGQKDKTLARTYLKRKNTFISQRVENFQYGRKLKDKTEDFQRTRFSNSLGKRILTFSWQEVIDKFGWDTKCYLTGRNISLRNTKEYQFDHIMPVSKGGSKGLDNLGITCCEANKAKHDMSVEELIQLSKEILEHNGYKVEKLEE
jgi:5-methylcytosine-specific restriction endonuclease McrA